MAELAEDNRDFAAAPQLELAPDAAPVRGPSMAANASAFIIPQSLSPEDCEPEALADDTEPIDPFNDGGGKPGQVESADRKSKRYFLELATENNIGGTGGGPTNRETPQEREARLRAEYESIFADWKEEREREEKEARKREFESTLHDFGGQKMSAAEISENFEWLTKKENQEKIRARMKAEGRTQEEIDEAFRKIEERKKLHEKLRNGTATKEERERYEELGKDRLVVDVEREVSKQRAAELASKAELKSDVKSEVVDAKMAAIESQLNITSGMSQRSDTVSMAGASPKEMPANSGYNHFNVDPVGCKFNAAACGTPASSAPIPAPVAAAPKAEIHVASAKIAAAVNDM